MKVVDFGIAQIEGSGRLAADADRLRAGHTGLHGARATARRSRRPARGHLRLGRRAERDAARPPPAGPECGDRPADVASTGRLTTIIAPLSAADPTARAKRTRTGAGIGVRPLPTTAPGCSSGNGSDPNPLVVGVPPGRDRAGLLGDGHPRVVRARSDRRRHGDACSSSRCWRR